MWFWLAFLICAATLLAAAWLIDRRDRRHGYSSVESVKQMRAERREARAHHGLPGTRPRRRPPTDYT